MGTLGSLGWWERRVGLQVGLFLDWVGSSWGLLGGRVVL